MTDKYLPRRTWFRLDRHDDPVTDPPKPPDPPADPPKPPEDQLGEAGKKALAEERAARKAAEKLAADQAAKLKEFEDRDKTEAEKLAAKAEAAEKKADAATARAVKAEVKALAADGFADPSDAAAFLDLSKYATTDGDVDADTIKADLAALLTSKPHLAKAATGTRNPLPDGSQGRGGDNNPADFRKADKAAVDAEMAKYGIRPRS